jgi:chromosomal replication initiator protein
MLTPTLDPPKKITPADAANIWAICLKRLTSTIPENQIFTWLKPVELALDSDCRVVTLWIANRFKLDWIRSQYFKAISHTLQSIIPHPVDITLSLRTQSHVVKGKSPQPLIESIDEGLYTHVEAHTPSAEPAISPTRLNSTLTFENLIEGSANRMARAASLHVANMPGALYNPLFIYGGVGLGKTHLMHAIGNQLLSQQPLARVLYIHAEQFVSDVVRAYQRKTFDEFKSRYHNLDLLLIDDVQFFANKERTQEEFFNAFEALLTRKSHIVMTSDTYPKGLTNIHERLVSRFDAGLTVALEPPELELRVAILINKTKAEGLVMPEDVAFFVAKNVRSNVRELEGALRKILAFSKFNQKEISIALARESLRDLLSIQNQQVSIENIQKTVADYYKIKVADMYSKRRPASIAGPRQIAMYLAKELTKRSLPEIGDLFGGRDHTTVLHAVRKVTKDRLQNLELNQQLHILEQTLKN